MVKEQKYVYLKKSSTGEENTVKEYLSALKPTYKFHWQSDLEGVELDLVT